MKTEFRSSFLRDLKKLKDRNVRQRVKEVIKEVEEAADLILRTSTTPVISPWNTKAHDCAFTAFHVYNTMLARVLTA